MKFGKSKMKGKEKGKRGEICDLVKERKEGRSLHPATPVWSGGGEEENKGQKIKIV